MKKILGAALLVLSLGGCAGYHVGPIKPYALRNVRSIAVPTFDNKTLLPRIAVLVTDTVINSSRTAPTASRATRRPMPS